MNFFLYAMLTSLICLSPAHAKQNAESGAMLRFSKFKSWDDVIADLDAKFPATIVKEFKSVVSDLPFPTIRVEKKNLVLVDSVSGQQWKFALGKEGTATINGEKLRIRPLETVGVEVLRLISENQAAVKPSAHTSMLMRIFPEAIAAPAGGASTAAAAYAGAQVHKANACAAGENSKELAEDCGAMGVNNDPTPEQVAAFQKKYPFVRIGFKCPSENNGVMEVIEKNGVGQLARYRTTFDDILPGRRTMEGAERNGKFMLLSDLDPTSEKRTDVKDYLLKENLESYYLFDKICTKGKEKERKRYAKLLEDNREKLRLEIARRFPDSSSTGKAQSTLE